MNTELRPIGDIDVREEANTGVSALSGCRVEFATFSGGEYVSSIFVDRTRAAEIYHQLGKILGVSTESSSVNPHLHAIRCRLNELCQRLREFGVVRVLMSYEGKEGTIRFDDFEFWDEQGRSIEPAMKVFTFDNELRAAFCELLQIRIPAWEADLGGSGEFEWNLVANALQHEHDTTTIEFHPTCYYGL